MKLTQRQLVFLITATTLSQTACFSPINMSHKNGDFTAILQSRAQMASNTYLSASYVPDGLTEEQYKKIKDQDKKRMGKDLGRLGLRGFKGWQEAFDQGTAGHEYAPLDYRNKLRRGEIQEKDVPYMVRGGHWDNRDVRGVQRRPWSKKDRDYANGGYQKEQSASILGSGPGFDWTGKRPRNANKNVPGLS